MTTSRGQRARRSKAVAEEAPTAAAEAVTTTPAASTPPLKCVKCGKRGVWQSDGVAADEVAYCKMHLPANVTPAMVARWRGPR